MRSGEAFYLRDEESGQFWSPTPLPVPRRRRRYVTRHGFGYSVFEHTEDGIRSELYGLSSRLDAAVKFSVLKVTQRIRPAAPAVSAPATSNGCWATCAPKTAMHVVTEIDADSGALFARNPLQHRVRRPGRVLRRRRGARAAAP